MALTMVMGYVYTEDNPVGEAAERVANRRQTMTQVHNRLETQA